MWKILLPIVFSILAFAKEMPITQTMEIYIPLRSFFIIEFPFEIKDVKFSPFEYEKIEPQDPLEGKLSLPKLDANSSLAPYAPPSPSKTIAQNLQDQVLEVSKGKHSIQIYAKKRGRCEMSVWGYKYPLLIKLIVAKRGERYIKLLDYDQALKQNREFAKATHEKICTKLIHALYNNTTPPGFKIETDFSHSRTNSLEIVAVKRLVGRRYVATEYRIKNRTTKKLLLNEPMFASNSVFAVSIENRTLEPGESTRLFIVYGRDRG